MNTERVRILPPLVAMVVGESVSVWIRAKRALAVISVLFALSHMASSGTVEFKPSVIYPVGTSPILLAVGDFNGDGKPDLAVRNRDTSDVSILLGNGNGTFRAAPNLGLVGPMAAGDFDGDHKDDLLGDDGSSLSLYISKGDGTFRQGTRIAGTGPVQFVADVNGDGRLDVINGSTVLLGNGDGTFQSPQDIGADSVLFVADFNADGNPDLLASGGIMLGNGDGTFQSPLAFPWPKSCHYLCGVSASNLVSADFNGDGHLDLAIGWILENCPDACHVTGASILYFYGNGDGTFRESSQSASTSFLPNFLMAADFNGDGKPDLAVAPTVVYGSSLIEFHITGGDVIDYDIGSGPFWLVAADLNGDGFPDIVSADYTEAAISVSLNLPPDFTLSPTLPLLSVKRGAPASEQLTIGSQAGFSDAVDLSCSVSGPVPMPTCNLTPSSVLPGDTVQLNINAAALSATLRRPYRLTDGLRAALLQFGLVGCVFITWFKKRRPAYVCFVLIMTATVLTSACGGGGSVPPAPVTQNYTITVTGTSGTIQHSTTVKLTVQ